MSYTHLCACSHRFRDIKCVHIFQKVGQGHRVQFSHLHHSVANFKFYKCLPHILRQFLKVQRYKNCMSLPSKSRSRSLSVIFAITPIDGKCHNLHKPFFTCLIFGVTCAHDCITQTNRQTQTRTSKPLANLAELPTNLETLHDICIFIHLFLSADRCVVIATSTFCNT